MLIAWRIVTNGCYVRASLQTGQKVRAAGGDGDGMCKGGGWGEQEHEQEQEQEEEQQQQRRRRGDAPKASQKLVRISLLHQPIILGSQVFLLLPTNCNNTLASYLCLIY